MALLGLGVGGVTVVATAPLAFAVRTAGVVLPEGVALSGTVWNGTALMRGHRASWQSRAWASVAALAWVSDLRISGPDTALTGQWRLGPGGVTLAPLTGRVGWSLLEAVMPGLEIRCATVAEVNLTTVTLARTQAQAQAQVQVQATGQIQLAAGTCARVDGTVTGVPLPALLADIATTVDGVGVNITGLDAPSVPLGALLLTPDARLRVTVHAAGAAMVPGLPSTGDSQIELPLALFVQ